MSLPDSPGGPPNGGRDGRRIAYELQNVGEISNEGWELQGSVGARGLSVSAAYALVDSRERALARGYGGELRPGDRMLDVPERTLSVTTLWQRGPLTASLGRARAWDWINYDRLALTAAFAEGGRPPHDVTGPQLRTFWRAYSGVTRVHASAMYDLGRALSVVLTADNLLDHQTGEPDNVTVLPGRTITGALRAKF